MMFEYASALAGLGLFLSGLHFLSASMKPFAGKRMRVILSKLSNGYLTSALAGTLLGAITQSTSGSGFVCMGLINSGALAFQRALTILAWSSVGGSLLVFLVSIDIRLAGLILVGIVGVSHLFNADRVDKVKYAVAILFALGLLLLGLGMIKEGGHLLRESQWVRDFIEFSSESTAICFIIGVFFTLVAQSASTVTIIGITLVIAGIIPFEAATILVLGSNVGSGLSLLLITSHLNGLQKQLFFYQFLTKLGGVILLMPIILVFPSLFEPSQLTPNKSEVAFQVSVIYLLIQLAGAILVSIFQNKITHFSMQLFPESEENSIAKTKYIYPEALEDPNIAINLITKEQERLIGSLTSYLEPLRNKDSSEMSIKVRNAANMQLAHEIKQFIDELSHHELGQEISNILELQSRNEAIISLLNSLNTFAITVAETEHYGENLSDSIIESLHLILTLMEESVDTDENNEILMALTSEKSQLMDDIRNRLLYDENTQMSERKSLYVSTRIYERTLWQIRQMVISKNKLADA